MVYKKTPQKETPCVLVHCLLRFAIRPNGRRRNGILLATWSATTEIYVVACTPFVECSSFLPHKHREKKVHGPRHTLEQGQKRVGRRKKKSTSGPFKSRRRRWGPVVNSLDVGPSRQNARLHRPLWCTMLTCVRCYFDDPFFFAFVIEYDGNWKGVDGVRRMGFLWRVWAATFFFFFLMCHRRRADRFRVLVHRKRCTQTTTPDVVFLSSCRPVFPPPFWSHS